ncbi:MAG: PfkB family carbohydrate kinase [Planctomycetota bacterium]
MNAQVPPTIDQTPERIIILGEVLVDILPNQSENIGGAPLNVAWNLRGLGRHPHLVSAIGADETGQRILGYCEGWGLSTATIQIDSDRPTGRVFVEVDHGEPRYTIEHGQAFDFIRYPHTFADSFVDVDSPILYHGSLCGRSPVSFETMLRLRRRFPTNIVVDLNLRDGHYTRERINELISGTSVLKCNLSELSYLTGLPCQSVSELDHMASSLLERTTIQELWVTAGADGAWWYDSRGDCAHARSAIDSHQIVDTVGAGDAFMAAVLDGMTLQESPQVTLQRAIMLADQTCLIAGATTNRSDFYDRFASSIIPFQHVR